MEQGQDVLAQWLLATLDVDPTIRQNAEQSLKLASTQPGENETGSARVLRVFCYVCVFMYYSVLSGLLGENEPCLKCCFCANWAQASEAR
jgi:hypothetical protein